MKHDNRWYAKPTQVFWTYEAWLPGRSISTKPEVRAAKKWRLAAVIHRLEEDYGWPILIALRGLENVSDHWLKPGTDIARLRFPPSARSLGDGLKGGDA